MEANQGNLNIGRPKRAKTPNGPGRGFYRSPIKGQEWEFSRYPDKRALDAKNEASGLRNNGELTVNGAPIKPAK